MTKPNQKKLPLLCWDIVSMGLLKMENKLTNSDDFLKLNDLKEQFGWDINLDSILEVPYDAIVVTNKDQVIEWTNSGFEKMTGYSTDFAIGKQPKFLQGEGTLPSTKHKIKSQLFESDVISATILNYKKDNQKYWCELKIFPVLNNEKEVSHFIAFEKEVV